MIFEMEWSRVWWEISADGFPIKDVFDCVLDKKDCGIIQNNDKEVERDFTELSTTESPGSLKNRSPRNVCHKSKKSLKDEMFFF